MEEIKRVTNEDVLTVIQAAGANGITAREIADFFGFSVDNVYMHVVKLTKAGLITKSGSNNNRRYFATNIDNPEEPQEPADVRIDDPAPEPSKHKPNQNHEGYNDPTATEAIKRMERNNGFMPGGIYKSQNGSLFLVVRTYPDTILGYDVDILPKATDTDSEVTWKMGANSALVHTNRVRSVSFKKLHLNSMQKCPFETFRDILRKSPFSACKTVEVPVETVSQQAQEAIVSLEKEVTILADTNGDLRTMIDQQNIDRELLGSRVCTMFGVEPYIDDNDLVTKLLSVHQYMIEMEAVLNELWKEYGSSDYDLVLDDVEEYITGKFDSLSDQLEAAKSKAEATKKVCYEDIGDQIRDILGLPRDESPYNWRDLMVLIREYKDLAEAPINPSDFGVDRAEFAAMKARMEVYKEVADKFITYYTS